MSNEKKIPDPSTLDFSESRFFFLGLVYSLQVAWERQAELEERERKELQERLSGD